jgi:prevent-host-death family protein
MVSIDLENDVRPITDVRKDASGLLQHVRESRRPLLITQHGRGAAVLLDVGVYQRMVDKLALVEAIEEGIEDFDRGRVVEHEQLMAELRERYADR